MAWAGNWCRVPSCASQRRASVITERACRRVVVAAAEHGGVCALLSVAQCGVGDVSVWGALLGGRGRDPRAAATGELLSLLSTSADALRRRPAAEVHGAVCSFSCGAEQRGCCVRLRCCGGRPLWCASCDSHQRPAV